MDNPIALEKQAASIRYQLEHLHENRTPTTIGLTTTFLILTTVAVVLRFASRKVAKVAYQIDDCLVGFSLVSNWLEYNFTFFTTLMLY